MQLYNVGRRCKHQNRLKFRARSYRTILWNSHVSQFWFGISMRRFSHFRPVGLLYLIPLYFTGCICRINRNLNRGCYSDWISFVCTLNVKQSTVNMISWSASISILIWRYEAISTQLACSMPAVNKHDIAFKICVYVWAICSLNTIRRRNRKKVKCVRHT